MIEYKGYTAVINVDFDDNILYGNIEGIDDIISFEGQTPEEVARAFREAVDDYLKFCEERARTPQVPRRAAA